MPIAHSKVTAQGQISVPAEVRRRLGIGPGSVLAWEEEGEKVVIRRVGRYTFEDIRREIFPTRPKRRTLEEIKEGPALYVRERYAPRKPK